MKFKHHHPGQTHLNVGLPAQVTAPIKFDIVLKCDATGCQEAIEAAVQARAPAGVPIRFFACGIGPVSKSDVFMAESGSHLVVGFNVEAVQKLEPVLEQCGVEIRLYDVIYRLAEDLATLARSLVPPPPAAEKILGRATVIALFKSSRKGIIIGCRVEEGQLRLGDNFRIISAMGPVYGGKITSLHIEREAVKSAHPGHQVGIKIADFSKVRTNDLVEVYTPEKSPPFHPWRPQPQIIQG